jgi:hypothetical protein
MKYRLKRDLPFAKAGEPVEVNEHGIRVSDKYIDQFYHRVSQKKLDAEVQRLISEGWIEEVKPREIWVNEYKQGLLGSYLFDSKESAEKSTAESGYIRTVKFVEVVE